MTSFILLLTIVINTHFVPLKRLLVWQMTILKDLKENYFMKKRLKL